MLRDVRTIGLLLVVTLLAGCPPGLLPIAVPDVTGQARATAEASLLALGLSIGNVSQEASLTVPAGSVLRQNPVADTLVAPGSAVSLVISTGPGLTQVPDLAGQTQPEAEATLAASALVLGSVTEEPSDSVPRGRVLAQSPLANALVDRGSAVDIVLSLGPAEVELPNVTGLTQAAAEAALLTAGLAVGTITQEHSELIAAGSVIRQYPAPPIVVATGSAVDLVISLGTAKIAVPGVIGMTQAAAQSALLAAGLSIGTVAQRSSETIPIGRVAGQYPLANTAVDLGDAVDLDISTGPRQVLVPYLQGRQLAVAEQLLADAELVVGTMTHEINEDVIKGAIIRHTPGFNTSVKVGSAVDLVVSDGAPCRVVPEITNVTEDEAYGLLIDERLFLGTVTYVTSTTVAEGLVISQDPLPGNCVDEYSAVDVSVSMGNVILINAIADLRRIGHDPAFPLNGSYALMKDLRADEEPGGMDPFTPIGSLDAPFTGNFDGRYHVIADLNIALPGAANVGMFGYVGKLGSLQIAPEIKNLSFYTDVTGDAEVGLLVGYGASGSLTNCFVAGDVRGALAIGGVVGYCAMQLQNVKFRGEITYTGTEQDRVIAAGGIAGFVAPEALLSDCGADDDTRIFAPGGAGGIAGMNLGTIQSSGFEGIITSEGRQVGGIAGLNSGLIFESSARGEVHGGYEVGGIAGRSMNAIGIVSCHSKAEVTATRFGGAGGLIGVNESSPVSRSYADIDAAVTNTSPWAGTGGLIGVLGGASVVSDCYAFVPVSGADRVGGLIGQASIDETPPVIQRCHTLSAVTSPGDKGGLIGWFDTNHPPTVTECFWDYQRTGMATSFGGLGTPLSSAQLATKNTFAGTSWNFSEVWLMINYPILR